MSDPANESSDVSESELEEFEALPEKTKRLMRLQKKKERYDGEQEVETQRRVEDES